MDGRTDRPTDSRTDRPTDRHSGLCSSFVATKNGQFSFCPGKYSFTFLPDILVYSEKLQMTPAPVKFLLLEISFESKEREKKGRGISEELSANCEERVFPQGLIIIIKA